MHIFVVLPILIPFIFAILGFIFRRDRIWQRRLGVLSTASLLVASLALLYIVVTQGIQVAQMGNWPAPFGIALVADYLSAIMVVLSGLMGLAVMVYSLFSIDEEREHYGYHPLFSILLMGVNGAFLTGDMFNLYVWFEVMLIASFVLLALGGERAQIEGAIKYVTLNLVSSAFFLAAVGILYGLAGTLNMAQLAVQLDTLDQPGLVTLLSIFFLISFGIKAAIFPLFFWLPSSYHTPPIAVSAVFAGLLTKVGVYALIRVFTLLFVQDVAYTHTTILMILAGFTMVTGVLGAAAQNEVRRILSFHIVSQIGYMIMGLALYTPLALAGAVFYIMHHIIVKTNLFLVGGVMNRLGGSYQLKKIGGLYRHYPILGLLFLIPALSLAGIPPLSGFWAKFALVRAGLEISQYGIVIAALAVSLLTIYSMTKIWANAFWTDAPKGTPGEEARRDPVARNMLVPVVALATLTVLIGFFAEPVFVLANLSAEQLLTRTDYVTAVLGDNAADLLAATLE